MIQIICSTVQSLHLEAKGHADYADVGYDIICSAVTSSIMGGIHNFQDLKKCNVIAKEGHILVELKGELNDHDKIVLETILKQLECIVELYPEYVKLNTEE